MKFAFFGLVLFLGLLLPAAAFEQTYWVWQRASPLLPTEVTDLKAAHVTRLYWQAGMLKRDGADWRWAERFQIDWTALRTAAPGIAIIPVVRIEASTDSTFPVTSRAALIRLLNQVATAAGAGTLQIDHETPDRLMPEYIDFLKQLKESDRPWRLSISALGHWSQEAKLLAPYADEITPMFYDLNPAPLRLEAGGLPSLIEPTLEKHLAAWKGCPLPWLAGLPNFSRITIMDTAGKSRGNLRSWSWDTIFFAPFLEALKPTKQGQTLFTVSRAATLGVTPVLAHEQVIIRYPDRSALREAQSASAAAGAQGSIYFRLADSGDPSGYSVRDLASAKAESPELKLSRDSSGRFVLTNDSAMDLMPVVRGKESRGYTLEVDAGAPVWREVIAGGFATAHLGKRTGLGAAQLEFRFAHLVAGQTLTTGYIVEAGSAATIRWRVRNLEKDDLWHSLK